MACYEASSFESSGLLTGTAIRAPKADMQQLHSRDAKLSSLEDLMRHHWDASRGMFLDWGRHTEDVQLQQQADGQVGQIVALLANSTVQMATCITCWLI